MPLTRKRNPEPDPEALYEPVQPFSSGHSVFNPGTKLSGSHEAVRATFGQWMLADLPDDEKSRIRGEAMWGQSIAESPKQVPDPYAEPPSGRFRAVRSWRLRDPDLAHRARINAGELVDSDDEVFRRYPHLFVRAIEDR